MPPTSLNKNNSAVKRIMQEAKELANDPSTDYTAAPLEDDIFEWHCTLRGPPGTEFEGGLYHFRILLPAEYPFRPPSIMVLTPNGRFELNTKVCISFTNYHEELWQPAWGVRTAIIGLQGFFPLKGQAAVGVGSIEYPSSERKRLAALSRDWVCPHCQQSNFELLPDPPASSSSSTEGPNSISREINDSREELPPATVNSVDAAGNTPSRTIITLENKDEGSELSDRGEGHVATVGNQVDGATRSAPSAVLGRGSGAEVVVEGGPTPGVGGRPSGQKPPVLLDTAICFLLVLLFAIICRRIV
ncbi:ubiquitin-conjugating enzyme/RWD-like protein [Cyathus striatus]|nr:ubiquitin-conjugating enzyme/RWD-like protein [Cyathus striatus]